MGWMEFWQWVIEHYIFHAVVVIAIIFIILSPKTRQFLRRIKKIGPTGLELEPQDIDPATPCPYTKSHDESLSRVKDNTDEIMLLKKDVENLIEAVKNIAIDQCKQSFYDKNQPNAERLAAGLKYICLGGNGLTKPDVKDFAKSRPDLYNALTKANPNLRLKDV